MQTYAIGVDIGGTNFRMGTVDAKGKTHHFKQLRSQTLKVENAAEVLSDYLNDFIKAQGIEAQIKGVAIGVPALVSRDKSRILSAPNLPSLERPDFLSILENRLGVPVLLDRDVNYLLLDDIEALSLQNQQSVLGFYVGTGLGNALYLDGKLYRGANGAAGELGHIPLYGVQEACTCENAGCAETRISGRYLAELQKQYFPKEEITHLFTELGDHPILQKYVRDLALPIATEINILDPQAVILSGGVLSMPDFPYAMLETEILAHLRRPYPKDSVALFKIDHEKDSAVRGAGLAVHRAV